MALSLLGGAGPGGRLSPASGCRGRPGRLGRPDSHAVRPVDLDERRPGRDSEAGPVSSSPWTAADPLGGVLADLRMRGTFYCRTECTAPWGMEMPALEGCLSFH